MDLSNIKGNALLILKVIWKLLLFVLSLTVNISLVILSAPIWLPIVTWKTGLLISDNIMKHLIDD